MAALRGAPAKLFDFRFCLIHLQNSSTCQRDLQMLAIAWRRQLEVLRREGAVLPANGCRTLWNNCWMTASREPR